jgi:hypothetical protein
VRARVAGGGEDWLTHVVWQQQGPWRTLVRTEQAEATLTAIDASMSCQVISCRHTRGAMVKRGAPIAWPRVFENSKLSSSTRSLPPL